jgi:cytochrome c oxidase subunit 3
MILFLSADAIMTLTFFAVFLYLRFTTHSWPTVFHFGSDLLAVAMTMFLLAGSFTIVMAVRADPRSAPRWIALTVALWISFLLTEGMEWVRLIALDGVTLKSNPYGAPAFGAAYYILTGLHAAHVIGGAIYLSVLAATRREARAAQWYVHFVSLIWLPIFFFLYLGSADLQGL